MVSAWATANHISLGQVVVDAKSHEITAIPKLLELIEISGSLVTIDAMGCQTEIAAKIVDGGADYCRAVKQNQPHLDHEIEAHFEERIETDVAEAVRGHGGIENSLHWQLDVTFGEDQCRVRKGHADANLSILRRTALTLLKNEPTAKVGIKNKRLTAAWDETYLEQVLFNSRL